MKFSHQHREGRPDVERSLLKPSTSRRRQWSPRRFGTRRLISRYIIAVLLGLTTLVVISVRHAHSWQTFFLPTDFTPYNQSWVSQLSNALPNKPTRELKPNGDIGHRYIFHHTLASGKEGSTSVYNDTSRDIDVVIKTYGSQHRAMRNLVPDEISSHFGEHLSHWPSEVPASLLFGGMQNSTAANLTHAPKASDFVPVYDYFLTSSGEVEWHWNFVTPLFALGTLKTLAGRLQHDQMSSSDVSDVHARFWPAFEDLHRMLDRVHEKGFCHDDVKAGNIFVQDEGHWILADLGAVREVQHPGHSTLVWKNMNQWQDCQQNDRRRLLKTYMSFLRQASSIKGSTVDFDERFFHGVEGWASMYWDYFAGNDLTGLSQKRQWRGRHPSLWAPPRLWWSRERIRSFAVDRELDGDLQDSWRIWRLRDLLFLGLWKLEQMEPVGHAYE